MRAHTTGIASLLRGDGSHGGTISRPKALATLVAMSVALLASAPTGAVTFMPGTSQSFEFGGLVEGAQVAGLGASLRLDLISAVGGMFAFQYSLTNISSLDSRVSSFGFASYPDVTSGGILGDTVGAFTNLIVETSRRSADYGSYKNIDLCLTSGSTCQGGNAGAVENGGNLGGRFYLTVANPAVTELSLTDFAVRYQGINGTAGGVTYSSASGIGTAAIVSPVPEPSVWAMMIAGLGVLVSALRRARQAERPAFAAA